MKKENHLIACVMCSNIPVLSTRKKFNKKLNKEREREKERVDRDVIEHRNTRLLVSIYTGEREKGRSSLI